MTAYESPTRIAYTTPAAIAAYLGVTLTLDQEAQAEQLAFAATSFIDAYTARTWQAVSPVTGEMQTVLPGHGSYPGAYGIIILAHGGVDAITAIALRTADPDPSETVLDASAYELLDPDAGVVTLAGSYGAAGGVVMAVVDYTYADAVPPAIALAATMLAAGELSKLLAVQRGSGVIAANPELAGLESLSVGQNEVSIKLGAAVTGAAAASSSAAGSGWAAPGSAVASILDGYRRWVVA